jgi:hypothetical protein
MGNIIFFFNSVTNQNLNINITKEYYKKMKRIMIIQSSLNLDPHRRKISKKVIKNFCVISYNLGLDKRIDNLTNEEFDLIYKEYVDNRIKEFEELNN